ncbi:TRAP transporter small permease [Neptunomonas phycophila]|uniref:TRAP transporter small permease n=1 Tax=Neptunomonas phycophila TaxID=1572645 RepID=UPI003736CE36
MSKLPSNSDTDYAVVYPSSSLGVLGWLDLWIGRVEAFMLGAGVLLMATNTVANVVGRFVFQHSLFFTEEVNRILIVLITFAGLSYAARHGRHIRMSALYDALPQSWRKVLMIIMCLVTALVMSALAYFSTRYILSIAGSGRVLPALQVPVYWIYIWVPIGLGVTAIQYAMTAWQNLLSGDIYLSTDVKEAHADTVEEASL